MKAWGPLEVRSLAFCVEERGAAARRHRRLSPVGSDTPGGPTSPGRRASGYRRGLFWRPRRVLRQLSRADSMAANRSDFLQPVARGDVGFKFGVPTLNRPIRGKQSSWSSGTPRPLDYRATSSLASAGLFYVTSERVPVPFGLYDKVTRTSLLLLQRGSFQRASQRAPCKALRVSPRRSETRD